MIHLSCAALSSKGFLVLSSHNSLTSSLLHDNGHGFEVVPLHFEVRDSAVPLRGFDPAVAQKILDGDQVCIGIK